MQVSEPPQPRRLSRCLSNMLRGGLSPTPGFWPDLPSSLDIHPNGATVFAEPDAANNAFDHFCRYSSRSTGAIRRGAKQFGQRRIARQFCLLRSIEQKRVQASFTVLDRSLRIHPGVQQTRRFHRGLNRGPLFDRYFVQELTKHPEWRPVARPPRFGIARIRRRWRLMLALQEALPLVLERA